MFVESVCCVCSCNKRVRLAKRHVLKPGLTVDYGLWTVDYGLWTVGLWKKTGGGV